MEKVDLLMRKEKRHLFPTKLFNIYRVYICLVHGLISHANVNSAKTRLKSSKAEIEKWRKFRGRGEKIEINVSC